MPNLSGGRPQLVTEEAVLQRILTRKLAALLASRADEATIKRQMAALDQVIDEHQTYGTLNEWLANEDPEYAAYLKANQAKSTASPVGSFFRDNQDVIEAANKKFAQDAGAPVETNDISPQEMMLRVLCWSIMRLGGEVVIPRPSLESIQYQFNSYLDELDRLHVTAEEVGGEEPDDSNDADTDLPF
jgi:hypothetical protein